MLNELLIFVAMMAVFIGAMMLLKMPTSICMLLSALTGALLAGEGVPLRHLAEGTFSYLSTIIVIATAMIFMRVIQDSGALDAICSSVVQRFSKKPALLLICLMFIVMFPGMITGSSTAAVLSAGSIVAPILMILGIPPVQTAVIISLGAILGKVAPPVNIAAMVIGAGADVPYVGFEGPLLLLTVPLAIGIVLALGHKYVKNFDYASVENMLDKEVRAKYGIKLYIPVFVLIALILCTKVFKILPDLGMPVYFLVSAAVGLFTGKKVNPLTCSRDAIADVLPVVGNLIAVGMMIQVMTMTGIRGMIVSYSLIMPASLRYLAMMIVIPAFGGISSLGAATVFGIPFILAFLGNDELIVASALSMFAAVGDIMPPSAISGSFAARITGVKKYGSFLKVAALPSAAMVVVALLFILFANQLSVLF